MEEINHNSFSQFQPNPYAFATWIPIFIFASFVLLFSTNIPWYDDFPQQFGTIERIEHAQSSAEVLFFQYNEHKLLTTYIIPFITYRLFGWIDMRTTVYCSALLSIWLFFFLNSLRNQQPYSLVSVSIAFLLLVPAGASTVWAGGSMQYTATVLFGLLSIANLTKKGWGPFIFACLCFFIASFSLISGLLAAMPGVLYLLVNLKKEQTATRLILFTGFSAIIWTAYFYNFHFIGAHPSPFSIFQTPIFAIKYYLLVSTGFLGGLIPVPVILVISFLAHVVLIGFLIRYRSALNFNNPLWFMWLFIFLNLLTIVAGRVGFLSLEQALSDRYQIYSACFWIFALLILSNSSLFPFRALPVLGLLIVLLNVSTSYSLFSLLSTHKEKLENALQSVLKQASRPDETYFGVSRARTYIHTGIEKGYYHPPKDLLLQHSEKSNAEKIPLSPD